MSRVGIHTRVVSNLKLPALAGERNYVTHNGFPFRLWFRFSLGRIEGDFPCAVLHYSWIQFCTMISYPWIPTLFAEFIMLTMFKTHDIAVWQGP